MTCLFPKFISKNSISHTQNDPIGTLMVGIKDLLVHLKYLNITRLYIENGVI